MNTPTDMPPLPDTDRVFTGKQGFFKSSMGYYLAGGLLLGMTFLGFVGSIVGDAGVAQRTVSTTLPAILAVSMFSLGYSSKRSPIRVHVRPEGLLLVYPDSERSIWWNELRWCTKDSGILSFKEFLFLYNAEGKRDVAIPDSFTDFKELVEIVTQRIGEVQATQEKPVPIKKNWFNIVTLFTVGTLAGAGSVFFLVTGMQDLENAERLAAEGVVGTGVITRHFLAPNGVTTRIEYEVTGNDGRIGSGNTEMDKAIWEDLAEGDPIAVRYVLDAPEINEVISGRVVGDYEQQSPLKVYGISAGMMIFSVFMLVVGTLSAMGIEIDFDSETNKFRIIRLGKL